jgi:hypothetical protein
MAHHAGLNYAGSLRPMLAQPTPLLALLGLPSASHVMAAAEVALREANSAYDVFLAAGANTNAKAAVGQSLVLLREPSVLAWMNNHSAAASAATDSGTAATSSRTEGSRSPISGSGPGGALDSWFTHAFRQRMRARLRGAMAQPAHILGGEGAAAGALQQVPSSLAGRGSPERPWRVAVHVRRGDVRSDNGHRQRHLPNKYYLRALAATFRAVARLAQGAEHPNNSSDAAFSSSLSAAAAVSVHVFSESASDESFAPFLALGTAAHGADDKTVAVTMALHLDTPLEEVWAAFKDADVLIMSKSSFSYVPALYRHLGYSDRFTIDDEGSMSRSRSREDDTDGSGDDVNRWEDDYVCRVSGSCGTTGPDRAFGRCEEAQVTLYAPFWHAPLAGWVVVPPLSEEASAATVEAHVEARAVAIATQLTGGCPRYR